MRPSMAGRMPILGQSPTKRPEVLTLVMPFLSCAGTPSSAGAVSGGRLSAYSGITTPMVSRMFA